MQQTSQKSCFALLKQSILGAIFHFSLWVLNLQPNVPLIYCFFFCGRIFILSYLDFMPCPDPEAVLVCLTEAVRSCDKHITEIKTPPGERAAHMYRNGQSTGPNQATHGLTNQNNGQKLEPERSCDRDLLIQERWREYKEDCEDIRWTEICCCCWRK